MPPDLDDSHLARNARAARLRRMNDVVRARRDAFAGGAAESHLLMCECPHHECSSMLQVTRPEYEDARSDSAWYVVHTEHLDGATLVRVADGYAIVRYEAASE